MKSILAILLSLTIGMQHCVQLGVYAWYSINKQMIAEQLCVNKNKPELRCEGKCYLGKQLKKAEEGEKRTASNILKEKQEYAQQYSITALAQPVAATTLFSITPHTYHIPESPVIDVIYPPG